jgi:hypothetical protein
MANAMDLVVVLGAREVLMEWTKIKPQHWVASPLNMSSRGCLVTLVCLTAMLERIPKRSEMNRICGAKVVQTLIKCMSNDVQMHDKCNANGMQMLCNVLQKVIDDCNKIEHKRAVSRETSDRYRNKQAKTPKSSDMSSDTTDKSRVDKSRVESIGKVPPAVSPHTPKKRFVAPTEVEVGAYCSERNNSIDPTRFVDFYESRGWKLSSGIPMKDWKAAIRLWEGRDKDNPKQEGLTYADKLALGLIRK